MKIATKFRSAKFTAKILGLRNFVGVVKFFNPCKISCDFSYELLNLPVS